MVYCEIWDDLSVEQSKRRRAYAAFLLDETNAKEDEAAFKSSKAVVGDHTFTANTRRDSGRATSRGQGRRRLTGQ